MSKHEQQEKKKARRSSKEQSINDTVIDEEPDYDKSAQFHALEEEESEEDEIMRDYANVFGESAAACFPYSQEQLERMMASIPEDDEDALLRLFGMER